MACAVDAVDAVNPNGDPLDDEFALMKRVWLRNPALQLEPAPNPRWPGRRTEAIALLVMLVIAGLFRAYRLDSIPPGFTHDEAGHGMDAISITQGARPIYETVGYGREPLYDYIVAALMPIFGQTYLVLRLVSVAAGLLLIVITHFWVRRAFDVPTALATTASLAVSFWAISTSRQALRSELLPVFFMASMYFLWRGIWPHERQTAAAAHAVGLYSLAELRRRRFVSWPVVVYLYGRAGFAGDSGAVLAVSADLPA